MAAQEPPSCSCSDVLLARQRAGAEHRGVVARHDVCRTSRPEHPQEGPVVVERRLDVGRGELRHPVGEGDACVAGRGVLDGRHTGRVDEAVGRSELVQVVGRHPVRDRLLGRHPPFTLAHGRRLGPGRFVRPRGRKGCPQGHGRCGPRGTCAPHGRRAPTAWHPARPGADRRRHHQEGTRDALRGDDGARHRGRVRHRPGRGRSAAGRGRHGGRGRRERARGRVTGRGR